MIVISNRPKNLHRFLNSTFILSNIRHMFEIYVLAQYPVTGLEHFLSITDNVKIIEPVSAPVPFAYLRRQAMLMAPDSDYFWSLDDDHVFANSNGKTFSKTCSDYYREVFEFLENNQDTGVVTCRGFVGGYSWGYKFVKNPINGLVATDKGGIFLKNVGVDKIVSEDEGMLVGALFESLAAYNILSLGYNHIRRYNSPVKNIPPGKEKHIDGSSNISYCDETVNANIQGYIRKKFDDPNWTHSSKKYPKAIAKILGVK